MARPRKTGLDYFPHDVDATTDPKLEPAILRYGAAAYAFYFVHLEYCYRADDLSVDVSETETGAEMREVIQRKLHISPDDYDGILRSLLRHGAFDSTYYAETGHLTSDGIKKRAGKVFEKRVRDNQRYENYVSTTISADVSDAETRAETTQSKAKKSKEKQSIEELSTYDVPGEKQLDRENERENNKPIAERSDPVPYKKIQELYNEICRSYPKVTKLNDQRKRSIGARWRETPNIKTFEDLFNKAETSNFLKGNSSRGWRASFDWMINPSNFIKILEGNYDDRDTCLKTEADQLQHETPKLSGFHIAGDEEAER